MQPLSHQNGPILPETESKENIFFFVDGVELVESRLGLADLKVKPVQVFPKIVLLLKVFRGVTRPALNNFTGRAKVSD